MTWRPHLHPLDLWGLSPHLTPHSLWVQILTNLSPSQLFQHLTGSHGQDRDPSYFSRPSEVPLNVEDSEQDKNLSPIQEKETPQETLSRSGSNRRSRDQHSHLRKKRPWCRTGDETRILGTTSPRRTLDSLRGTFQIPELLSRGFSAGIWRVGWRGVQKMHITEPRMCLTLCRARPTRIRCVSKTRWVLKL